MKQVLEAALEVQEFLESKDWRFCFIGGLALQRWAIPRNTLDADLTLMTGIGDESDFVEPLLERFTSRIENDPLEFFIPRRIVLLRVGNVGIDISLGTLDFEELAVSRSSYHDYTPGIRLRTCSAEDLIVFKAFADRSQDWVDIENIISIQAGIDWGYVKEQLGPLIELKEDPEIMDKLLSLRK